MGGGGGNGGKKIATSITCASSRTSHPHIHHTCILMRITQHPHMHRTSWTDASHMFNHIMPQNTPAYLIKAGHLLLGGWDDTQLRVGMFASYQEPLSFGFKLRAEP